MRQLPIPLLFALSFFLTPFAGAAPSSTRQNDPITHRIALIIGNNHAGSFAKPLRYAELDARKVRSLLVQLGGYPPQNIWLLLGQPASVVQRAMNAIQRKLKKIRRTNTQPPPRIVLFLYFSGHAQKGRLLLGDSTMLFRQLKQFLHRSKVSLRLAVFDACESGSLTRSKGLKRRRDHFRFPFVRLSPSATGEIFITATGERESAHEDSHLRGGIFTHYFISGLRGAADLNNDGHVTLEEAYTYSYNRSLERTILSSRGPQRARFSKRLSGYGSLILTSLSKQRAWLQLHKEIAGEFFIWTPNHNLLLAEVVKSKGRRINVALPPGRYILQWRRHGGVYHKEIELKKDQQFRLGKVGKRLAYWTKHQTRGPSSPEAGAWKSFHGQLVGPGLAVSYRVGFSGIDLGVGHQGPQLHFLLPLEQAGAGHISLLFQTGYQYGFQQINDSLKVDLHLFDLDVGLLWTLLEIPQLWLGAGAYLRANLILQAIYPRLQQPAQNLLSPSFGSGGIFLAQFGFSERLFVQLNLAAGARFLDLGGSFSVRWALNANAGLGIRF